jgi:hypothetical protein
MAASRHQGLGAAVVEEVLVAAHMLRSAPILPRIDGRTPRRSQRSLTGGRLQRADERLKAGDERRLLCPRDREEQQGADRVGLRLGKAQCTATLVGDPQHE